MEIARRFVAGAWNAGNLALVDDLIHRDYVVPGVGAGPEAVKKNIITFRTGFPDLQWVIEDVIAEGDKVVLRLTLHGTHLGEFHGIPATGKQVTMQEIVIWEVRDGQIRTGWFAFDGLGLRIQLGAIPDALSSEQQKCR
jgi:steroid delta-isomerase-like uncharacterized protein